MFIEITPDCLSIRLIKDDIEKPYTIHCKLEVEKIKTVLLVTEKNNDVKNYQLDIERKENNDIDIYKKENVFFYDMNSSIHSIEISNISFFPPFLLLVIFFFFNVKCKTQ